MARGRPKTLPPSRFVGVLVPISMLDKVEDVRREGQKQCSAYSFSEAIRDMLAKGLDVTWKPVERQEQKKKAKLKRVSFERTLGIYQNRMRIAVRTRPSGQHWTTAIKNKAKEWDMPYWTAANIYHGSINHEHIAYMKKRYDFGHEAIWEEV
jgi:hypothetical protein